MRGHQAGLSVLAWPINMSSIAELLSARVCLVNSRVRVEKVTYVQIRALVVTMSGLFKNPKAVPSVCSSTDQDALLDPGAGASAFGRFRH